MPLSVQYIESLGVCWSPAQLAEAAASWPSPTPSWSWFLGERLRPWTRRECMLRIQVALAHVVRSNLAAPLRPGAIHEFLRTCDPTTFVTACDALGKWLDTEDELSRAAFAAVLGQ